MVHQLQLDRPSHALGNFLRPRDRCFGKQDGDLLASIARADVFGPDTAHEDRGDGLQHLVPCLVSIGIVHRLEVIDVGDDERGWCSVLEGFADDARQLLVEVSAIGETCQWIGAGDAPLLFDLPRRLQ